ncbi:biotin-independent malonate decarboxylase subunit beta [Mycolicibacterium sp. P9-64]|uniref:biotin-independent malonate decarboxylase subunit beta n=1 Tax=Mycolicibacterium sp. P9-64 TaxID=2024612 RepID=UPI0011ED9856|nr:biotin-independent malonate decarboxylase subunit beta [Mycolicibacterium sp. P9-64]KAA0074930.1 biotin-independent malonate decarboxylase subunit beta [Mycolicibacterium sp. P9-64]
MTDTILLEGQSWQQLLTRRSFIELDALGRATALLDPGSARVLAGPFDRLESPWLAPQGITPQADDGTTIARGTVDGRPVVIAAIEQGFQGGGTGEVSGAKISQALLLAARETRASRTPVAAVILFETGGVRLQEANLGLNAVAEICSAVLDLRPLAPVIGIVAGTVGSFGGMSIAAGLCTRLIVTPQARIGLNGPAVIEQEGGVAEFDASDHALIWAIDGGEQRCATGLADDLVPDDADLLRAALIDAVNAGVAEAGQHRSQRLDVLASRLATLDPSDPPSPDDLRRLWGPRYTPVAAAKSAAEAAAVDYPQTRGRTWLRALVGDARIDRVIPSVLMATTPTASYLAVVPDPGNRFYRAREGQVGLTESLALAQAVHDLVDADDGKAVKRAIIAVVDLPSQAYGRNEEMGGLHQAMAAAVDAYHHARNAGHPIVAFVVGTALSGGFLTHGLQANQILALDDPRVEIHAMHAAAAARITLRTVDELNELAKTILPMSYRVEDWAKLGFCDGLLTVENADAPTPADAEKAATAISDAIERARRGPRDLANRLDSEAAVTTRHASRAVRELLARQWNPE